jgi:pyridoxal phosphate-dependent aminotransferase EpsN
MKRIHLSVPHMSGWERKHVNETFASNWLSTVGPNIDAFEREVEELLGIPAVAVSSGTAAIHLCLQLLGVRPGDEVFCQDLTFIGTASPIVYLGANPVFIDSNYETWNIDPNLLADTLHERAARKRLPRAVIAVDLYGQCADMDAVVDVCNRYEIPVLEDAAEALGGVYKGRPAGTMGAVNAFSFNGNKIITTTGGGMLASHNRDWLAKARFRSMHARLPGVVYEHPELGFNYRMSNVLAAIGRGQLKVLNLRVAQRRAVALRYKQALADVPGLTLMPQAAYGVHTNWLSCFMVDEDKFGAARDTLVSALDAAGAESRPVWKPMHMQPVFQSCSYYGGAVGEDLFRHGICLPSSSNLTLEEQLHVVNVIRKLAGARVVRELASSAAG